MLKWYYTDNLNKIPILRDDWDTVYNLFYLQLFFYVHNIISIALDWFKKVIFLK